VGRIQAGRREVSGLANHQGRSCGHPLDPRQDKRGYLLNVYVEPEHRRKRLASHLIDQALAEARKQKIRVVALHSTDEGRPLYESNGFRRTNEMFYVEPVEG
jgi:ribosomal protein S18 acetylase RimI-like enzyme